MALPSSASSATTAAEIKRLLQETEDDRGDLVRLDELRKVFARLVESGELDLHSGSASLSIEQHTELTAVQKKWRQFLVQSHKSFLQQLNSRIRRGKQQHIRALIRTFWGVVASTPRRTIPQGIPIVSADLLLQLVQSLTRASPTITLDKGLTNLLAEFLQYRDVQYYLLIAIASHADTLCHTKKGKNSDNTHDIHQMLFELLCLVPIVTTKDELGDGLFLFPPPVVDVSTDAANEELHEDSSSTSSDEEEDDESDDDDDSEDEDDESILTGAGPPAKKQKVESVKKFAFQTVRGHHRALSKAWHAVLRLSLPEHCLKQALVFLPNHVLPMVSRPLLFADFFMSAYQHGGVIPILALDGLFLLMTRHRLEYPDFYKQLYRILTPQLFFVKYRTRFFRLLDKCLKNDLLPAHIVAAFVKRLCRCTMSAPPSATLFALALCSNLIRKHPETACLIHRTVNTDDENHDPAIDGYVADTDDPEEANALASSLWEVQVLERHYSQQVATLAKSLGRPEELSAPLYHLEDFLGHTYTTLMEHERKPRKARNKQGGSGNTTTTPLTFVQPQGLLVEGDVFSGILEKT